MDDLDEGSVTVLLDGDEEGSASWDSLSGGDDLDSADEITDGGPKFGLSTVYSLEVEVLQNEDQYQELPSPSVEQKRSSMIWPRG